MEMADEGRNRDVRTNVLRMLQRGRTADLSDVQNVRGTSPVCWETHNPRMLFFMQNLFKMFGFDNFFYIIVVYLLLFLIRLRVFIYLNFLIYMLQRCVIFNEIFHYNSLVSLL